MQLELNSESDPRPDSRASYGRMSLKVEQGEERCAPPVITTAWRCFSRETLPTESYFLFLEQPASGAPPLRLLFALSPAPPHHPTHPGNAASCPDPGRVEPWKWPSTAPTRQAPSFRLGLRDTTHPHLRSLWRRYALLGRVVTFIGGCSVDIHCINAMRLVS